MPAAKAGVLAHLEVDERTPPCIPDILFKTNGWYVVIMHRSFAVKRLIHRKSPIESGASMV